MQVNGKSMKGILILVVIGLVVFALVFGGLSLTQNLGKSKTVISTENAMKKLDSLYKGLDISNISPRKAMVDLDAADVRDSLPDISKYPLQVVNTTDDYAEIFTSTEKGGTGTDGWLVETAEAFNRAGIEVNGRVASVQIRAIASGMGTDYITSGKYIPDAFTPSNELWGEMIKSRGIPISLVDARLTGNVAGVVVSKAKYDAMIAKYGSINLKTVTEAVAANELAMGYTDPFSSSTAMNFLTSALYTFDQQNPLGEAAVAKFEAFQTNVPYVASTTLQMRESAKSGQLDAFVLEYQTFYNTPDLQADYQFVPFGVRHDSPLYALGNLSSDKQEILKKFAEFCKSSENQKLASKYGFNNYDDYKNELGTLDGNSVAQAQKLWKEKKNGSKEIAAVFVADTSGSMEGEPLNNLKKSLISSAKYIGKDNSVGLVTFSNTVNVNLPISKFDINQMSYFVGAVEDMQAGGGTAMFDAIVVASKMLMEEKAKNPDVKLMLFVLSDGETNYGYSLNNVEDVLKSLVIPVYTIGYNADIKVMQNLSNLNEAASINADTDDVIYKLANLFNAQL